MSMKFMTAEKEYEKNKDLNKVDLESLKDWASKQPHLPQISEFDLIVFLHSCHWSVERAKHTIDTYYTIRTHVPEFFAQRDSKHASILNAMEVLNFFTLPGCGPNGEMIFYGGFKNKDYTAYNFADSIKYFMHVTDLMLQQYGTFSGFLIVVDVEGVTMGHVTKLGIMTMKKILTYLQEAIPVRLAGIHFIHPVSVMDKILALMRPFLKPELTSMLYVHPSMDVFYKHVVKDTLPKDLGGQKPTVAELDKDSRENVLAHRQFFIDEEKQRVVESNRPGKAKDAGDLFGVEGSFKKLDID